jgi:hypothetical protein
MGMSSAAPKSSEQLDDGSIESSTDLASFFHENVARALAVRQLEPPEPTTEYLVRLLADLGHDQGALSSSWVELELEAQAERGSTRLEKLRLLGDRALSYAGLFDAHRERCGLSAAYVESVGQRAYHGAFVVARCISGRAMQRAHVFHELSENFRTYRDVLDDVREATSLGTADDVLSLYERFVKTKSPMLRSRLAARGVFALDIDPEPEPA